MRGRKPSKPIYILPHGIEVIGEYAPTKKNPYWRVRVRPHRFFNAVDVSGGSCIRRSRVVMASKLGRALESSEQVHHSDENKHNDHPDNLELLTSAEHNQHHKVGTKHTPEARRKISIGLSNAIAEGRRSPPPPGAWIGRTHTEESRKRMSMTRTKAIAEGRIAMPKPPVMTGYKHTDATKLNMRKAALLRWEKRK